MGKVWSTFLTKTFSFIFHWATENCAKNLCAWHTDGRTEGQRESIMSPQMPIKTKA